MALGCFTDEQSQYLVLDGVPWGWWIKYQTHTDTHQRHSPLWQNCNYKPPHQDLDNPWILQVKSAAEDETQRATEHVNDDDFQFAKTKWEKEEMQCLQQECL